MNCLMRVLLMTSFFVAGGVRGAPAVTRVHVSFISGNKKTQYSHGTHTRPAVVQYNLDAAGTGYDDLLHGRQVRSISTERQHQKKYMRQDDDDDHDTGGRGEEVRRPSGKLHRGVDGRGRPNRIITSSRGPILIVAPTTQMTTRTSKKHMRTPPPSPSSFPHTTSKSKTKLYRLRGASSPSPLTFAPVPTIKYSSKTRGTTTTSTTARYPTLRRLQSSRVRFIQTTSSTPALSSSSSTAPGTTASAASFSTSSTPLSSSSSDSKTADTKHKANMTVKLKDTKAVKRSPYIENFESRGITFPDFDEFGGNDFGALRNLIGGSGGGGGNVAAHSHANPESLSPDGVFLPPLPTEASDYAEDGHGGGGGHSDPYVADPETAKYAAQHPPFFAAFPHKRTVLDLNERRVEQGLEPNILRSIRPYFSFFEAANGHHHSHHHHHDDDISLNSIGAGDIHGIGLDELGGRSLHQHPATTLQYSPFAVAPPTAPSPSSLGGGTSGFGGVLTGGGGGGAELHADPNVLLYAHSLLSSPGGADADIAEAWSVFPQQKRRR